VPAQAAPARPDIDEIIGRINKRLKSETLRYANTVQTFTRTSTGSLAFDLALGGGWPLNVWNEIIGLESHGKTVMAIKTVAAAQIEPDHRTLWIASEDFNVPWAEALGADTSRIVLAETNIMEDAYGIMIEGLDSKAFDAIVLDSYPALVPRAEEEATMDDWVVGLGARLTNKLMRKSTPSQRRLVGERDCLCLIINQWLDSITSFGDPRTTPGGKGKNFSYFTRVEVARDGFIDGPNKVKVGQTIKMRTMKNKTAPPHRVAVTDFYFDDHFPFVAGQYDSVAEVWNIATTYGIIERRGSRYYYQDQEWVGKDPVLASLREDLGFQREIDAHVRHHVLGTPLPAKAKKRLVRVK